MYRQLQDCLGKDGNDRGPQIDPAVYEYIKTVHLGIAPEPGRHLFITADYPYVPVSVPFLTSEPDDLREYVSYLVVSAAYRCEPDLVCKFSLIVLSSCKRHKVTVHLSFVSVIQIFSLRSGRYHRRSKLASDLIYRKVSLCLVRRGKSIKTDISALCRDQLDQRSFLQCKISSGTETDKHEPGCKKSPKTCHPS